MGLFLPRALFTAAAVATVLVACTPVVPPHLEYRDRMCDALCKRRSECLPGADGSDVKSCETNCRESGSKRRPYWRADYVDATVQCLETSTCGVIKESVERTCFLDTRPEPSDLARRACMAFEAKQRECVGAVEDIDACLNKLGWRLLSDPVLAELLDCEGQRCGGERRMMCVNEAFGGQ
jgi:hypothetical protein